MKVDRSSRVQTEVQWVVTITMDEDEFMGMLDYLPDEMREQFIMGTTDRFTIERVAPNGEKRKVTQPKEKRYGNV